jgi:ferritin-like protein
MKPPTDLGMNRTGMDLAPLHKGPMLENSAIIPSFPSGLEIVMERRQGYLLEADPVGNVPFPGTFKGLAKATLQKITGNKPEVFIDKLGERLAFERTGVRLYEHLINKCLCREGELPDGLLEILIQQRNDEETHFHLLNEAMKNLGADPTAMTPGADVSAVASLGLVQVLSDPRTSIDQGLQALLTAELVDTEGWELLIELADHLDLQDMKADFQDALLEEEEHLIQVRMAHSNLILGVADIRTRDEESAA